MTRSEIASVEALVHAQSKWAIGKHATGRMATKGIEREQVLDVLSTGRMVEVNRNNDLCALFRKEYGNEAVCVVVSLETRWVVTVWKNQARDKHRTLDATKYLWDVDVCEEMAVFA